MKANQIDRIVARNTAFSCLHEMLDAKGGYRPSIYGWRGIRFQRAIQLDAMARQYDLAQQARGDSRRAYRGHDA